MEKIKGGYYIKARAIQLSEISTAPPHVREVWDWLLREANHAPYKNIARGEVLCTYTEIIEGLHWLVGWRKMTYTKHHMTTAMRYLKKATMITTRKTTRGMVVSVCKYSHYQDPKNYGKQQGEQQRTYTGEQQRKPHEALHDIQEERRKKKEEVKTIVENSNALALLEVRNKIFESLWLIYPARRGRKIGKAEASKKFLNVKEVDIPLLTKAIKNLASDTETLPKDFHRFIKDSKGEPWRDWIELAEPTRGGKGIDKYIQAGLIEPRT